MMFAIIDICIAVTIYTCALMFLIPFQMLTGIDIFKTKKHEDDENWHIYGFYHDIQDISNSTDDPNDWDVF